MSTKICNKCKIEKPVEEFYPDPSRKDKLRPTCKSCVKEAYYANREANIARQTAYQKEHVEEHLEAVKRYRKKNRARILKQRRALYAKKKAESAIVEESK